MGLIKKLLHYSARHGLHSRRFFSLHLRLCIVAMFLFAGGAEARTQTYGQNQGPSQGQGYSNTQLATVSLADLPVQARQTMSMIKRGGPFPYEQDGSVFGNYERILPTRPRGYYREYTVRTPAARDRGARRIVAGGTSAPFREYFYTDDHYASFKQIDE